MTQELSKRDKEIRENAAIDDLKIFELREGRFAHRKAWNSPTMSVCSSGLFKSDDFRQEEGKYHEWIGPMDFVLLGKADEYFAFKPTDEDMLADDWEIADVSNSQVTILGA